ncbi:MAG: hypothetical protein RSA10_02405 [Bacilli bacterium]
MIINNKKIEEMLKSINKDSLSLKSRGNGIYLSDDQIKSLEKYNINYKNYSSVKSLIFALEECINEESLYGDVSELEKVEEFLCEYDYYNNTNK